MARKTARFTNFTGRGKRLPQVLGVRLSRAPAEDLALGAEPVVFGTTTLAATLFPERIRKAGDLFAELRRLNGNWGEVKPGGRSGLPRAVGFGTSAPRAGGARGRRLRFRR